MLNTKGLVALTEQQQVGWRLIKIENWDKKIAREQKVILTLTKMVVATV